MSEWERGEEKGREGSEWIRRERNARRCWGRRSRRAWRRFAGRSWAGPRCEVHAREELKKAEQHQEELSDASMLSEIEDDEDDFHDAADASFVNDHHALKATLDDPPLTYAQAMARPDALEWKPERWLSPLPQAVIDAHLPGVYSHLYVACTSPEMETNNLLPE